MGFETAVQTAVYQKLSADAGLMALVTGVYDSVPQDAAFPYVTIGEDVHNAWDTFDSVGSDATITVHTWSVARGRKEVKEIQGAIYEALSRTVLTYSGYGIISIDFDGSQSFMDADGLTRHGVQTFRVLVERN